MMVWQTHDRNEWAVAIDEALGVQTRGVAPAPGPDPFSLGEPRRVQRILAAARFAGCDFSDVSVPVYYGRDVGAALAFVGQFANVRTALKRSGPLAAASIVARLRAALESRSSEQGTWIGSRAWIVTARRR